MTTILGHTLQEWEPQPPNIGPPLPKFLNIDWPWYKVVTPPPPPPGNTATLVNYIYDTNTGLPISGATVKLGSLSAVSDSGGNAVIPGIPLNTSLAFSVTATGYVGGSYVNRNYTQAETYYISEGLEPL